MVFEINFCAVNFIPYFQIGLITCNERLSKRHLVRLVSSDNLKVFIHSEYSRVTKKELNSPKMYEYSPMDKKGEAIVQKLGRKIIATFPELTYLPKIADVRSVAKMAMEEYLAKKYE